MRTITLNEGRKLIGKAYTRTMCGYKYIYLLHNFMKDVSDTESMYVFFCTIEAYKDGELVSVIPELRDANHFYNEVKEGNITRIN